MNTQYQCLTKLLDFKASAALTFNVFVFSMSLILRFIVLLLRFSAGILRFNLMNLQLPQMKKVNSKKNENGGNIREILPIA